MTSVAAIFGRLSALSRLPFRRGNSVRSTSTTHVGGSKVTSGFAKASSVSACRWDSCSCV